ncbi:hypothetical protein F9C28_17500 [Shimwellia pseudoproteus]|uniref:hypothetical protein n=1 Tax=Shimwellia pseudoproteus TaxID=570012 RepID=UPI0018EC155F|nr:hypothetical protein [Shimwellia pseudoproteus]MBJ3816658.1 hypothetical protein [Shimwellia pseudoproteus]
MVAGLELLVLQATDIRFVSRAAQQIVKPLTVANSKLVETAMPVNPDEVKFALDRASVAINSVERKLIECAEIITGMDDPEGLGLSFTNDFPGELKARAELLTDQIENLKNVFSLVETSASWKPYLSSVQDRRKKAVRAISNLRNAYLNIAMLAEQYISPVPTVESSVEGSTEEFTSAVGSSNRLLDIKQSEWR